MQRVTRDNLGELSLAEWEYAWRFLDYLQLGDERPSRDGWIIARVVEIERRISRAVRDQQDRTYRDLGNRIR